MTCLYLVLIIAYLFTRYKFTNKRKLVLVGKVLCFICFNGLNIVHVQRGGQKCSLTCDVVVNFNAFPLIMKKYLKHIKYTIIKTILV